ncbi:MULTISPECIES: hypothetical protein [Streptomyces]|uniref:hypothetical protein n=1 Tax=Streptomyces TaxID=1883 RepID=UPI00114CD736|nr:MULTISPECIES: hypothetical protein [unclassified Streptomyces]MYT18521.1 hypothetical protein [Streptomyces sp. SID4951]
MTLKLSDVGNVDQNFVEGAATTEKAIEAGAKTLVHKKTGLCLTLTDGAPKLETCAGGIVKDAAYPLSPEAEKARAQNWKWAKTPDGFFQVEPLGRGCLQRDGDKLTTKSCIPAKLVEDSKANSAIYAQLKSEYEMQKFLAW